MNLKRLYIVLFVLALLLNSCGVVEKLANRAPTIKEISAEPDTVMTGSIVYLSVSAVDEDGDDLAYSWGANAGYFQNQSGTTIEWIAPDTEGLFEIEVTVHDTNEGESKQSIKIFVVAFEKPTVLITQPTDNEEIVAKGSYTINVDVSPPTLIQMVSFFINDDSVSVDKHRPYQFQWDLDARNGQGGRVEVKAIAYRTGFGTLKGQDSVYVNLQSVVDIP